MKLGIIVVTNKSSLPENFLRRLMFADEVLFVYQSQKPKLDIYIKNAHFLATDSKVDFATKRNLALKNINTKWVLFVDDDEIITEELAKEIRQKTNQNKYSGFYLSRHDICFYQELKYGEIKNQKILRLAKLGKGEFKRSVHEVWNITGKVGCLSNVLYHQKSNFISEFIGRIRQYGPLDADSLNQEGKPFTYLKLLLLPKLKFLHNYFLKLGYKDGLAGLFLAYLMSVQSISVRIYQWEKTLKQ